MQLTAQLCSSACFPPFLDCHQLSSWARQRQGSLFQTAPIIPQTPTLTTVPFASEGPAAGRSGRRTARRPPTPACLEERPGRLPGRRPRDPPAPLRAPGPSTPVVPALERSPGRSPLPARPGCRSHHPPASVGRRSQTGRGSLWNGLTITDKDSRGRPRRSWPSCFCFSSGPTRFMPSPGSAAPSGRGTSSSPGLPPSGFSA